jgi:hypothetical protein
VKKLRSFAIENAGWYFLILRLAASIGLLGFLNPGGARARSWSYHYQPITPQPSPAAASTMAAAASTEQLSTARLLKRAIVSDLAIMIQEQGVGSGTEKPDHSKYMVSRLLLFDPMDSPEALGVFASLSGYYLGERADKVYQCLTLRRGKTIEPLLAEQSRGGDLECGRELGQKFERPSSALNGKALCRGGKDRAAFLAALMAEIDSGRVCSNDELAAIGRGG